MHGYLQKHQLHERQISNNFRKLVFLNCAILKNDIEYASSRNSNKNFAFDIYTRT